MPIPIPEPPPVPEGFAPRFVPPAIPAPPPTQTPEVITPKFVPAPKQKVVIPAAAEVLKVPPKEQMRPLEKPDSNIEFYTRYTRTELPGNDLLFRRQSEAEVFEGIAQDMKRQAAPTRALFPPMLVSKEVFQPRSFPKVVRPVEPSYVMHGRLLFEQPNFERIGYSFGVLQPAICLGVFYYDAALLPYHICSDLKDRSESNAGKCLPGDPAPFLIPIERFSVTGLIGQFGAIAGGVYLMPKGFSP